MIKKFFAVAVLALAANSASAQVTPTTVGPAPAGTVKAGYDPATGLVVVTSNGVLSWYLESTTGAMTGPDTPTLPAIGGALVTDNDARVGHSSFGTALTYQDQQIGRVAAPGLALSNFILKSSAAFGAPEIDGELVMLIPEPASIAMSGAACLGLLALRRKQA